MMRRSILSSAFVSIALASLVACGGRDPTPTPRATPTPAVTAPTPTEGTGRADEASIPEADVRAAIDTWTAAQNQGDFDRYAALYAPRFQGVRRNGDRTRTFDHDGWLDDRRRMFRRPIVVSVSDLAVRTSASTADVTFTQRWSSGSYADEGPKRIVFVRENGAMKISVEEMLAARRLDELDAALALGTFVALPTRQGSLALIADAPASSAVGEPMLVAEDDPFVAVKAAAETIPASLRALVGRTVSVIERGRACEGRVESIRLAMLVVPHFGTVAEWNGTSEDAPHPPLPAAQKAREAWGHGTTPHYAAMVSSTCDRPVAVSFAPLSGVSVFSPREPTSDERRALDRAFERTARFTAREDAYREFANGAGPEGETVAPPAQRPAWRRAASVVVFENGGRRVGTVVQNAEGCGGFEVSGWSGFSFGASSVDEIPEPSPIGDYISVMAVFDVDGDGSLEAIVRRDLASYGVVRFSPAATLLRRVNVEYLDCPC